MHTEDLKVVKAMESALKNTKAMSEQQRRGKRQQQQAKPNPKPAQKQGRHAPPFIHSTELDPMPAHIEELFLADIARLSKTVRQFVRAYVPGEAHPFVMPEGNRTTVTVTAKQRFYRVDEKPTLYVDLRHRLTAEEKAERLAYEAEQRNKKIPGGAKGQRPFRVTRDVIMEREI